MFYCRFRKIEVIQIPAYQITAKKPALECAKTDTQENVICKLVIFIHECPQRPNLPECINATGREEKGSIKHV